jgi:glucose/mannose transport system substrate-binding protein
MRNAQAARHAERVQRALALIESRLDGPCDMAAAAATAEMSVWHFQRVFRRLVGVAPQHYARRRRLSLAAVALADTSRPVHTIALDCGFESHEVFTRAFKAQFGLAPQAFRQRGVGAAVDALQLPLRASAPCAADGADIEVVHWLADGSEARAMSQLRDTVRRRGLRWRDVVVPGGGGRHAMELLRARGVAGRLPGAAQLTAPNVREWARCGALAPLDAIAEVNGWNALLPQAISDAVRHDGRYVAAPLNVHRVNTLWVNLAVLRSAGVAPPRTWDDLLDAAQRLQDAGITPLALSEQPWQLSLLFEGIALSLGGPAFYRRAFVQRDADALGSATMLRALALYRRFAPLARAGRARAADAAPNWIDATQRVVQGRAAMQFTGDWAKGEFEVAGLQAQRDFACLPVPGTEGVFAFSVDALAMFAAPGPQRRALRAQQALGHAAMERGVQQRFNQHKGSIPARCDVSAQGFDIYARSGMQAFSAGTQALVPAWGAALPLAVKSQMEDVLLAAWQGRLDTAQALAALARAGAAR